MSAPDPNPENARATENALRWLRGARAEPALVAEVRRAVRARRQRRTAVLASAAAMAVGLWFFTGVRPDAGSPAASTAIVTEPRRQILPDGSVVVLREGAEITADFSATARRTNEAESTRDIGYALTAEEVAEVIVAMLAQPPQAWMSEVVLRPLNLERKRTI